MEGLRFWSKIIIWGFKFFSINGGSVQEFGVDIKWVGVRAHFFLTEHKGKTRHVHRGIRTVKFSNPFLAIKKIYKVSCYSYFQETLSNLQTGFEGITRTSMLNLLSSYFNFVKAIYYPLQSIVASKVVWKMFHP